MVAYLSTCVHEYDKQTIPDNKLIRDTQFRTLVPVTLFDRLSALEKPKQPDG